MLPLRPGKVVEDVVILEENLLAEQGECSKIAVSLLICSLGYRVE